MTYYYTDKSTGEMTPVLAGLHRKPTGKVRRLPPTHYPPRRSTFSTPRSSYRRPQPLGDLAIGIGCTLLACAILIATTVGPS